MGPSTTGIVRTQVGSIQGLTNGFVKFCPGYLARNKLTECFKIAWRFLAQRGVELALDR